MRYVLICLAFASVAWADLDSDIVAAQAKVDSLLALKADVEKAETTRATVADSLTACTPCQQLGITAEADSMDYMYVRLRFPTTTGLADALIRGTIQELVDAGGKLIWDQRVVRDRHDRALAGIARLKAL